MAQHASNAAGLLREYVAEQQLLLAKLDDAIAGIRPWPRPEEYEAVARVGWAAFAELLRFREELKELRRESRVARIQRLSAAERYWQPSPELWLRRYTED
ncbi:hypothetical protein [Variovorax sp. OV329]|uniref:hypothetical protein n=1 Tax=Variovorax sp. OV329 TaxID=1882825 RepID=UPI0011146B07|nr:hypothetical protein [Variovorax sp. OV329]